MPKQPPKEIAFSVIPDRIITVRMEGVQGDIRICTDANPPYALIRGSDDPQEIARMVIFDKRRVEAEAG
jgi:hypothetical protein